MRKRQNGQVCLIFPLVEHFISEYFLLKIFIILNMKIWRLVEDLFLMFEFWNIQIHTLVIIAFSFYSF